MLLRSNVLLYFTLIFILIVLFICLFIYCFNSFVDLFYWGVGGAEKFSNIRNVEKMQQHYLEGTMCVDLRTNHTGTTIIGNKRITLMC